MVIRKYINTKKKKNDLSYIKKYDTSFDKRNNIIVTATVLPN